MSITTEASSSANKPTRTNIAEHIDDIPNIVDDHNKSLVIILAVTLPTLACIALSILLIVCYRRRHTAMWLKKSKNSSRLQATVVNLSPTSIRPQYSEKNLCLSYPQFQQPRTKTIVYNRLNSSSSSTVYSPFKLPIKGENNAAFDEYLFKNEQQPIVKSSSTIEQLPTTLQKDFPVSLQAPVPIITSVFVEAIAKHRLSLLANTNSTSSERSASTSTNNSSRHSGTSSSSSSYSNSLQRLLLFSQRTEF